MVFLPTDQPRHGGSIDVEETQMNWHDSNKNPSIRELA
jgi:hypothetical protein